MSRVCTSFLFVRKQNLEEKGKLKKKNLILPTGWSLAWICVQNFASCLKQSTKNILKLNNSDNVLYKHHDRQKNYNKRVNLKQQIVI